MCEAFIIFEFRRTPSNFVAISESLMCIIFYSCVSNLDRIQDISRKADIQ